MWEAQWAQDQNARLHIEWSGFEPWAGSVCCVLGQDTLLSQCLSLPRCINGYRDLNAGGNPTMHQHPIQGEVEILKTSSPGSLSTLSLRRRQMEAEEKEPGNEVGNTSHATETGIAPLGSYTDLNQSNKQSIGQTTNYDQLATNKFIILLIQNCLLFHKHKNIVSFCCRPSYAPETEGSQLVLGGKGFKLLPT